MGYERIPDVGEVIDERVYILTGSSILKTGVPTGWSLFDTYGANSTKHSNLLRNFNGISITKDNVTPNLANVQFFKYPIIAVKETDLIGSGKRTISYVQPYMDHPMLAGIIYSLPLLHLNSIETFAPAIYRFIPTHVFFWLNSFLFLLVGWVLSKKFITGIVAFFIYTTDPSYVLSSRFALLENMLIPLILISLLLLSIFQNFHLDHKESKRLIFTLGALGGLSLATKESGIAVCLMDLLLLVKCKLPRKFYKFFFIPLILLGGAFYFYYFALSPSLLLNVLKSQSSRGYFGPLNFFYVMRNLSFHNFPLDAYWLFGFVSIFFLMKNVAKNRIIIFGFLSTLVVYLFLAGPNYSWYALPFVPFLVLAASFFITEMYLSPNLLSILTFFVLPFSSSFYWGQVVRSDLSSSLILYRIFLIGLVLAVFALTKKYKRILIFLVCIVLIFWNIKSISFIIENWGALPEPFFIH